MTVEITLRYTIVIANLAEVLLDAYDQSKISVMIPFTSSQDIPACLIIWTLSWLFVRLW